MFQTPQALRALRRTPTSCSPASSPCRRSDSTRRELATTGTGTEARHGRRLPVRVRRPPPPRPPDERVARVLARGLGVEVRENCEVTGFVRTAATATAVRTNGGRHRRRARRRRDRRVDAAAERELGCRVPIQPGKGYSVTMPRPALCPTYPLIFEEHRVAVTPFAVRLPPRLDDGVRRVRRHAEPLAPAAS